MTDATTPSTFAEPPFGPWHEAALADVVERVVTVATNRRDAPLRTIAVDGRSGAGKSTFAAALADVLPRASVVHTDDVAWHHSFFDWHGVLIDRVLEPVRAGHAVRWRPDPWSARDREGFIEVPADTRWLIVEGAGAAARPLGPYLDAAVWVASDPAVARARELARDGEDADTVAFVEEWAAAERAFMEERRPWERADVVTCGTPDRALPVDRLTVARWPRPGDEVPRRAAAGGERPE